MLKPEGDVGSILHRAPLFNYCINNCMEMIYLLAWDDGGSSGIGGFYGSYSSRKLAERARRERIKDEYAKKWGTRKELSEHYYIMEVPFIN